jgi:uncharacterized membrane protein
MAILLNNSQLKVPCTLGWPYTEGIWWCCDCFIWCVSCTVVVLTCFVMYNWVYVGVFWQLCGCFGNTCTCIYCVLYCLYCVFVLFRLCIFILIYFVCTSVRTSAKWKSNCSNNNNNDNNNNEIERSSCRENLPHILIYNFCLLLRSRVAVGVARKVNHTPQTRKRNCWKKNGD